MISLAPLDHAWEKLPKRPPFFYKIGPFTLQIVATEDSLAQKLTRALEHLSIPKAPTDWTIRLWNNAKLPPLDWEKIYSNGYRGYAKPPVYFHYFDSIGALSAIDLQRNIAYYAVRDERALPWWVSGSPLQALFHIWFRNKNIQLTHSGSIGTNTKALLLAGKGGSGKSTTVLSCLREGLYTLGEDYTLLAPEGAYSIYQSAKWELHTRTLFPFYESALQNPETADREKALIYYKELFPQQILSYAPIHAVVSLQLGSSSFLQSCSYQTSLKALLLTTATQLPHPSPDSLQLLQNFVRPLAHYQLSLGPNLKENVNLLKGLLL